MAPYCGLFDREVLERFVIINESNEYISVLHIGKVVLSHYQSLLELLSA